MEIKEIVAEIKKNGRANILEGHGRILELIAPSAWVREQDDKDGIFLLFDTFQIRTVAEAFSELSLDIVDFATKPTIYHSPVSKLLTAGPVQEGVVRFSLIKKDIWNKLLFAFGQPLIFQFSKDKKALFETKEFFPLLSAGTKEFYLDAEGTVKIIKA